VTSSGLITDCAACKSGNAPFLPRVHEHMD
jgi:hypothetical protein